MKAKEDQNPTAYAREIHKEYNLPKWMKIETIAVRYRKGERDIKKLIAEPMTNKAKGERARRTSELNPFYSQKQKIRT